MSSGLNSAYDQSLALKNFDLLSKEFNCESLKCLRDVDAEKIGRIAKAVGFRNRHPTKFTLEPGFNPTIDGILERLKILNWTFKFS